MSSSPLNPGLIPGSNLSGTNISLPFNMTGNTSDAALGGTINPLLPINTSSSTSFPMMPQGAISNSSSSGFPAPVTLGPSGFTGAGAALGFPANTGAATSGTIGSGTGGGLPGIGTSLTPTQAKHLQQGLDATYGKGIGDLIVNFLQGGAGYNQQAIQNLIAQLQPTFSRQQQDLLQQFSAGGSRFGSGGQIGLADLMSQQGLEVGSLETQMYESAINNFMQILMGSGGANAQRKANSPSGWDIVSGILGIGKAGVGIAGGIQDLMNG